MSSTLAASRRTRLLAVLAIVVLVALPIRLYLAGRAAMISRDGAAFIWYAQRLADCPIAEMREQPQHPLYPALVLAAHGAVRGVRAVGIAADRLADPVLIWQSAAMAVTLIGGLAVVVATYVLASLVFDWRVGLIAAVLAATAAEFCQLSADALTDMPHLAAYLFAMAAAIRGIQAQRKVWLFVAGVLSGLAFLIRPEGAEVAVVAVPVVALFATSWPRRQRFVGIIVLALGAALPAAPYMLITGKLVQKKSVPRFLGGEEARRLEERVCDLFSQSMCEKPFQSRARQEAVAANRGNPLPYGRGSDLLGPAGGIGDVGRAMGRVVENWCRALRVTFLLPAVVWLVRRRRVRGEPHGLRLIAMAVSLHVLILVALLIRFDYWDLFSLRHVVVLAGLTLPFSAAGVAAILDAVRPRWQRGIVLLLAVGMIAPTLPWLLETRHADRAYLRRAGEWISGQSGDGAPILTTRHRVTFYAKGERVLSPLEANASSILDTIGRAKGPEFVWLVVDERHMLSESPEFFDDLGNALLPGAALEEVHVESASNGEGANRAIIYRYRPPP